MATDHIRYDLLAQEALRGVLRKVLADAAKRGLPGEHHFYITFDTRAEGVRLSQRMRTQYPEQMTIVLQHQFWDLTVEEQIFEVGLSFGGVPERLAVPFAAVKGFLDPSVQFGLQFEQAGEEVAEGGAQPSAPADNAERDAPVPRAAADQARPTAPLAAVPTPANPKAEGAGQEQGPDKPAGGGEVVRLDRFRKK
jgi:uncharacterized protein